MIKSLTITNHLGESIELELGGPEKSGFFISKIEGLGPSKATINTAEMATGDGSLFNSSRVMQRNIVLTLGFLSDPTIEDVRQRSYKYFPIKKQILIRVETDNRVGEIYGYVESNEPIIFSSMTGTVISIICPDPNFRSLETNTTVFSGIESTFSFEFSNESLTENLIEFGSIINRTEQTVYYTGDADAGVSILIHAIGAATNIAIYNNDTRESMEIDTTKLAALTGAGVTASDDILISTVNGDKYIYLLRNGIYTNILNCLGKDTDWFHLVRGDNLFSYTADTGLTNLQFKIENQILYEGV